MKEKKTDLLSDNYKKILQFIQTALQKAKRSSDAVKLLAVTKGQSAQSIRELHQLGQIYFSENYVQEWQEKKKELANQSSIQWHFTGRIQTNKIKYLIDQIQLFHSIDRLELAEKMNRLAEARKIICRGLLEINLGEENSKGGIHKKEMKKIFEALNQYKNISIEGLMILPPYFEDPELSRPYFQELREILFDLNQRNIYREELRELSMGTSHDFSIAIEEGATWVRVGRRLLQSF